MLIVAGLLARKARALGLKPPSWVKTSLGPGSRAAAKYLGRSGLLADLEALGFGIVGFGCTTCIGNSGPLVPGDGRGDRATRRDGGGGALRQSQLPRPGAWADRSCLPRLAAARGRVRHRRDASRLTFPANQSDASRDGAAGVSPRCVADRRRDRGSPTLRRWTRRTSPTPIPTTAAATSGPRLMRLRPRSSHGIRTRPTCAVRRSSHCRHARPGRLSSSPAR